MVTILLIVNRVRNKERTWHLTNGHYFMVIVIVITQSL